MQIRGKVALITGASSGVGAATARQMAMSGARVMINFCHSEAEATKLTRELQADGADVSLFRADVADDQQARRLVDATQKQFGALDVLINNAGTTKFIPFSDLEAATDEVWREIMNVNLLGAFHMIRAASDLLAQGESGEIVNVTSVAGVAATGSSIPYACSKAALNTLTVAMARTLAPKVRVNAVAPGFIDGRWLRKGLGDGYDRAKQHHEGQVPLRRVSQPEDIANAIMSIICGSDMVTGQVVVCDGGMLLMDPMGPRA